MSTSSGSDLDVDAGAPSFGVQPRTPELCRHRIAPVAQDRNGGSSPTSPMSPVSTPQKLAISKGSGGARNIGSARGMIGLQAFCQNTVEYEFDTTNVELDEPREEATVDATAYSASGWSAPPSPLIAAVCQGHVKEVEQLLQDGAEVNARDMFGYTPLFQAAAAGNAQVITRLMIAKADASLKTATGSSVVELTRDQRLGALIAAMAPASAGLVADLPLFDEAVGLLPEELQEEVFNIMELEPRVMRI